MATNDFRPFANDAGANVATLTDYSSNSGYALGYQSGVAQSKYLNRTWRQSSMMAAAIGQFIADQGTNAVDDGSVANLKASFLAGLTNFLNTTSLFASMKVAAGFQKLPGGLIIQWGQGGRTGAGNVIVNFPIAFPVALLNISATIRDITSGSSGEQTVLPISAGRNLSSATFSIISATTLGDINFEFIAIGY